MESGEGEVDGAIVPLVQIVDRLAGMPTVPLVQIYIVDWLPEAIIVSFVQIVDQSVRTAIVPLVQIIYVVDQLAGAEPFVQMVDKLSGVIASLVQILD